MDPTVHDSNLIRGNLTNIGLCQNLLQPSMSENRNIILTKDLTRKSIYKNSLAFGISFNMKVDL